MRTTTRAIARLMARVYTAEHVAQMGQDMIGAYGHPEPPLSDLAAREELSLLSALQDDLNLVAREELDKR